MKFISFIYVSFSTILFIVWLNIVVRFSAFQRETMSDTEEVDSDWLGAPKPDDRKVTTECPILPAR